MHCSDADQVPGVLADDLLVVQRVHPGALSRNASCTGKGGVGAGIRFCGLTSPVADQPLRQGLG